MSEPSQRWAQAVRETLSPRYAFHARLGSGGFATVWRVTNRRLERDEALKVLSDVRGEDAEFVARFTREAQIAAALDHPNIVHIYEFGTTEGIFWYSMQLVDGPTLQDEISGGRVFSEQETVTILAGVLDALAAIHDRGVVHRDVKPANIVLDSAGSPHLMDFGIAKIEGPAGQTMTGAVMGTPAYVAPEGLRGEKLDSRADLYAVGVTAYEMLSGRLPYENTSPAQLLLERVTQDPHPVLAARPDLHPALAEAIMHALAAQPEERFASAREMSAALQAALAAPRTPRPIGPSPERRPPAPPKQTTARLVPVGPPPRRRLALQLATALAVAGLAVGLGWLARRVPTSPTIPDTRVPQAVEPRTATPAASSLPAPTPVTIAVAREAAQPAAAVPSALAAPPPPRRAVSPPQLIEGPPPQLPGDLATLCAGKSIRFAVEVDEAGKVRSAKMLGSAELRCREIAENALRGYLFRPALDAGGAPVSARLSLAVSF